LNSEALEITRGEKPGLGSPELLIEVFDSLTTPDLALCIHLDFSALKPRSSVRNSVSLPG
jgi:hypothetical protein